MSREPRETPVLRREFSGHADGIEVDADGVFAAMGGVFELLSRQFFPTKGPTARRALAVATVISACAASSLSGMIGAYI
jgi:hypothetical protein